MDNSILLQSPALLVGFVVALILLVISFTGGKKSYIFSCLAGVVFVVASLFALLGGTTLFEMGTVCLIFLATTLVCFEWKGGKR